MLLMARNMVFGSNKHGKQTVLEKYSVECMPAKNLQVSPRVKKERKKEIVYLSLEVPLDLHSKLDQRHGISIRKTRPQAGKFHFCQYGVSQSVTHTLQGVWQANIRRIPTLFVCKWHINLSVFSLQASVHDEKTAYDR